MFTEPELAQPWELWVRATALHHFIAQNGAWLWPIFQTLHYFGLSLLLGTVGLFDLRVLGVGKAVPPATLHKLIPHRGLCPKSAHRHLVLFRLSLAIFL